ncbi:hypothetical protein WR25_08028 [Diploscapter pachys]|uniref:Uncharacterized protein n=1 Tax=Diploscapter pachys TaxID=2018661 RepID=A0A2A2JDT6_9BILA|nr:hypothetical protein WR25_08028 [Diploscapter pachys]
MSSVSESSSLSTEPSTTELAFKAEEDNKGVTVRIRDRDTVYASLTAHVIILPNEQNELDNGNHQNHVLPSFAVEECLPSHNALRNQFGKWLFILEE